VLGKTGKNICKPEALLPGWRSETLVAPGAFHSTGRPCYDCWDLQAC